MYLKARVIGVLTYVLLLLVMYLSIKKKNLTNEKLMKKLKIYNILLAVLAFFYIPNENADLYRIIQIGEWYSDYSLLGFVRTLIMSNYTPVYELFLFIVSKIGMYGILPAVASYIFHGCSFKILYKAHKDFNVDSKDIADSLLLFMISGKFAEVISNIRCLPMFSLIGLCIYEELIEKKKPIFNVPKYVICCLVHPAAYVLTFFRFLFVVIDSSVSFFHKFLYFIFTIIFFGIIIIKSNLYVSFLENKIGTYLSGEIYSYFWEYLISFLIMIFVLICLIKFKNIDYFKIKNYYKFLIIICLTTFIFSFEYTIFTRFQTMVSILFLPIYSILLSYIRKSDIKFYIFNFYILMNNLLILLLACVRGNLCGFKFF